MSLEGTAPSTGVDSGPWWLAQEWFPSTCWPRCSCPGLGGTEFPGLALAAGETAAGAGFVAGTSQASVAVEGLVSQVASAVGTPGPGPPAPRKPACRRWRARRLCRRRPAAAGPNGASARRAFSARTGIDRGVFAASAGRRRVRRSLGSDLLDLGASAVLGFLSDVGELRDVALGDVADGAFEVAVGFLGEQRAGLVLSPAREQLFQRGQLRGMLFLQIGEFAHASVE